MLKYGKEIKIREDIRYYLSDLYIYHLEYETPRKNIINGLKNIKYGRKLISEDNYELNRDRIFRYDI